jgi:hypothetical protein
MSELFSGVLGVTLAGAWIAAVIPFYGLIAFLSWII